MILLYAPFWQHGAILHLLQVNPGTDHEANSIYEFVVRLYSSITGARINSSLAPGSPIEVVTHWISIVLFIATYGALCLRTLFTPRYVNTLPALIRWMALAWLLYCIVGSPWFWPWYTITFFGLFALTEAEHEEYAQGAQVSSVYKFFPGPLFARVLTIAMLSLYSFSSWQPVHGGTPFLPHFEWVYSRGLWVWTLPFLVVGISLFWQRGHKQPKHWKAQ